MENLFKSPVLVKPLGVIVPAGAFENKLSLNVELQRVYSLVEPTSLTSELFVAAKVVARFTATVVMEKDVLALSKGAEAYNTFVLDTIKRQTEMVIADEQEEEPTRRGRGRRSKAEATEPVEAPVIDYASMIGYVAKSFAFLEVTYDEKQTTLIDSKPFTYFAEKSENNEAAMHQRVAQMSALMNRISQMRAKLVTPSRESINDSLGSLVPHLDNDTLDIDRQGLENFESNLRHRIEDDETKLRNHYTWFNQVVIEKYAEKNNKVSIVPFAGSFSLGDTTVTLEEVISAMQEELFISVKL